MKRRPRLLRLALALLLAGTAAAGAGEIDIVGFSTGEGLHFQGATVSNYFTLEFAPTLDGPWTNWGAVSSASITGTVMSLPTPFFYRIVQTPSNAFPPYATGTPVYVESDPVAAEWLVDYETKLHAAATYQPAGAYLTNNQPAPAALGGIFLGANGLGIGTTNPLVPIQIGTNVYSTGDYAVAVGRVIQTNHDVTGHAFLDYSLVMPDGLPAGFSYNSYDAYASIGGTNHFGHYNAFQARADFNSSGTIGSMKAFTAFMTADRGHVSNFYGYVFLEPIGDAAIGNIYGLYLSPISKGTNENWAIYSAGQAPSYFGGGARIGGNHSTNDPILQVTGSAAFSSNVAAQRFIGDGAGLTNVADAEARAAVSNLPAIPTNAATLAEIGGATGTPVYAESDPVALEALCDYETETHAAATFQPAGNYLVDGQAAPVSLGSLTITTNGKVGIGQTNPISVFSVGNLSYSTFHDFMITAARAVDDTKHGTNGHAFLDGSTVDRGGNVAYYSFESHAECIETNDYSEIVSFRNANAYSTSGTVNSAVSFDHFPRVENGVINYLMGLHVRDYYKATSGTGIVQRQYGVYVRPLTKGKLGNYAFYSEGSTPSRFGQILLGTNAAISNWPSGGGTVTGITFNGVAADVAGGNASLTFAPSSLVVSEDYTVQTNDGAVGADTADGDVAITLPDLDDRFASVLIRKFSADNALVLLRGTNMLETLTGDGETSTYDWWPDRADWFRRN